MKISLAVVSCLVASTALACSGAPSSGDGADYEIKKDPAPPAATSGASGQDAPPPAEQDTPAPASTGTGTTPPAAPPVLYEGTLAATSQVPFGGSPYCKYDVTLKNVVVDVKLTDAGDFDSATASDVMNETAVAPCPYAASAPSNQTFTATKATVGTNGGLTIEFAGGTGNQPATALVVDLTKGASGWNAAATWTRTDQTAPLAWTVTAKVTLAKK